MDAINKHRRQHCKPSELLGVDESISRWYGLGGSWIDVGSPHYVALERKPENGLEVQNVACGRSGISMGLKIVKSADKTAANDDQLYVQLNHGTKILADPCAPWNDFERIVCGDSYFASVQAAETLLAKNLRFTGVIKTYTKRFPISYFNSHHLLNKGDFKTLMSRVNLPNGEQRDVAAVCWLDIGRRDFFRPSVAPCRKPSRNAGGSVSLVMALAGQSCV